MADIREDDHHLAGRNGRRRQGCGRRRRLRVEQRSRARGAARLEDQARTATAGTARAQGRHRRLGRESDSAGPALLERRGRMT